MTSDVPFTSRDSVCRRTFHNEDYRLFDLLLLDRYDMYHVLSATTGLSPDICDRLVLSKRKNATLSKSFLHIRI